MKILYYNWVQFDKINNYGGGVNVYQKNVIEYLTKNTSHEIYFLSSGCYYDVLRKGTHIKETKNIFGGKCKSFKIINSKCTAPSKAMYEDIDTYLNDETTYNTLKEFINKYGEFDIIHFNNIEGLSAKCLEIKKDFPNIKIIYSIHNYFLFCPQINLFFNEQSNCIDFKNGERCCECLANNLPKKTFITFYKIDGICEKLHMEKFSNKIKLYSKKIIKKIHKEKGQKESEVLKTKHNSYTYLKYREENVKKINKYVDVVLAVSDRVRKIAINMGIDEKKIYTNYIGTEFAKNSINHLNSDIKEEYLTIAYMGYFDKFKGYDFLIETLETLPDEVAKKIKFLCYAKVKNPSDEEKINRLKKLDTKLYSVEHYNGYTHKELPSILSNINLGIIPVIWEDNLPQVAIEYVAHGVPILCSNLGGAHELSSSEYFVFKSGSKEDFTNKLTAIVKDKELLKDYFMKTIKLTTMEEHIKKLLMYYNDNNI